MLIDKDVVYTDSPNQQQQTPTVYPEPKLDQSSMKFTSFVPIPYLNTKNVSSIYLKSESQSWSSKKMVQMSIDERMEQHKRKMGDPDVPPIGSKYDRILVLQPGSRYIKIGRSNDPAPLLIPSIIARKKRSNVSNGSDGMDVDESQSTRNVDEWKSNVEAITNEFKTRMRAFKLVGISNGQAQSVSYNQDAEPEPVPDHLDNNKVDWIDDSDDLPEVLVGDDVGKCTWYVIPIKPSPQVLKLTDKAKAKYDISRPFFRGDLNTRDYTSAQVLLGDIATLLSTIISKTFSFKMSDFKNISIALIIPNSYNSTYITEMSNVILNLIGCKQILLIQEANCATFGCGLSSACLVDIGAQKTSIACVEEGVVLPESRMELAYGGDDVTEFLHDLLKEAAFPYKEADLTKSWDWSIFEGMKEKVCNLNENDLAVILHEINVRKPDTTTTKYSTKIYEDSIKAPTCLFNPRVLEFDKKLQPKNQLWGDSESTLDIGSGNTSQAMQMSTMHLAGQKPTGNIDVQTESSKVPLHIAIKNSIAATTTEERIKKFSQSIVISGGSSHLKGVGFGIESRLLGVLQSQFPFVDKLQIIPPPKDVEAMNLSWSGTSVLSKLEVSNELWVGQKDFNTLGLKALKDRTYCMQLY
ncbi:actin-like ATPase domain-containing protein [Wallemia mellicola]|nr:actin-like ATPase domain-containing protein [Wallemia mellicola]